MQALKTIKFGTDGWRDVIGHNFTFSQLRRVSRGVAGWLKQQKKIKSREVLIGYDTRFFSARFAQEAAWALASEHFEPILSQSVLPTPCLSWNVKEREAACGIMITSSHNPGRYNGFKIKLPKGCSAFEEQTREIEQALASTSGEPSRTKPSLRTEDFISPYMECLKGRVQWKLLSKARLKVVSDSMHGAAGSLLSQYFSSPTLKILPFRHLPDPLFGGVQPEPIGVNLLALQREVRKQGAAAGVAHDGDADRVGLVDENGDIVNAHQFLGLLLQHYIEFRKGSGDAVRTFSGTQLVDRLCRANNIRLHETPVGFKHIARIMLQTRVMVGGEESNGFGFGEHLPERDGLLGALVLLELLAAAGKPLSTLVREMRQKYGLFHYDRIDLHLQHGQPAHLGAFLKTWQPEQLAGLKVREKSQLDGTKFLLEGDAWLLLRTSGTEPLIRLYSEALSQKQVEALLNAGQQAIRSFL